MPRAAPGDYARGVLRRDVLNDLQPTVGYSDSVVRHPSHPGAKMKLYRCGSRSRKWCRFTLQFSGFGVERDGLGEVVSLVGDCRPPPPGNPRRPFIPVTRNTGLRGWRVWTVRASIGGLCFNAGISKSGELLASGYRHRSLNIYQKSSNLKELNNPQYFKINRSYSSCVERKPVLEFLHFHSHLCGQLGVKPPPIAITNVLEIRKMICAVLIAEMKNPG
jgi:hypothetical protein